MRLLWSRSISLSFERNQTKNFWRNYLRSLGDLSQSLTPPCLYPRFLQHTPCLYTRCVGDTPSNSTTAPSGMAIRMRWPVRSNHQTRKLYNDAGALA
jgi:hypothetical protein